MGVILAKFRKAKTTFEVLEKLEEDIKSIEEYSVSTQARQKRFVGNFLVVSIGLYVVGFIVVYFAFFPPTWTERITYSVPMLIIPLLIFLIKRLVAWYFQRKLNKNSSKLSVLRAEKKKLIEKVMEKETYKVAIEILNRFGGIPKTELKSPGSLVARTTPAVTPVKSQPPASQPQSLATYRGPAALQNPRSTGQLSVNPAVRAALSPQTPLRGNNLFNNNNSNNTSLGASSAAGIVAQRNTNLQVQSMQQRKRTPYPIINQRDKGVLEKMVDYLIGDGPQNRFAMICKECLSHNGMALQEEYEYAAFRCAFCGTMNPSRKLRPIAPKLLMATPNTATPGGDENKRRRESSSSSTSTGERDSGPDSDVDDEKSNIEEAISLPCESEVNAGENDISERSEIVSNATTHGDPVNESPLTEKTNGEKKND